ncbi:MAG TPA: hypothetical protein PKB07_22735 [Flavilitoribacter sp.]|nr:hypothetical protein [Flavilitoribacter sp.]
MKTSRITNQLFLSKVLAKIIMAAVPVVLILIIFNAVRFCSRATNDTSGPPVSDASISFSLLDIDYGEVEYAYNNGTQKGDSYAKLTLTNGRKVSTTESLSYWSQKAGLYYIDGRSLAVNPKHACYYEYGGKIYIKTATDKLQAQKDRNLFAVIKKCN